MLKRFYGRVAAKDDKAKKDGGDGDAFVALINGLRRRHLLHTRGLSH
jgi:hypothetical protein